MKDKQGEVDRYDAYEILWRIEIRPSRSLLVSLNNSFARAPLFNNWVEAVQIHLEQEMKLIDVSKKLQLKNFQKSFDVSRYIS